MQERVGENAAVAQVHGRWASHVNLQARVVGRESGRGLEIAKLVVQQWPGHQDGAGLDREELLRLHVPVGGVGWCYRWALRRKGARDIESGRTRDLCAKVQGGDGRVEAVENAP